MHVADTLQARRNARRIAKLLFQRQTMLIQLQGLIVIALVVVTIPGAGKCRDHFCGIRELLQRSLVIRQCLGIVVLHVEGVGNANKTLAAATQFSNSQKRLLRRFVISQFVLQTAKTAERVLYLLVIAGGLELFESLLECVDCFVWFALGLVG